MAQTHLLVPQLPWMERTPYTACLRLARALTVSSEPVQITCPGCKRVHKAVTADGEHPLYHFFHRPTLDDKVVSGPEQVWKYMLTYAFEPREAIHAIYTNSQFKVLEHRVLSVGNQTESLITPRMVFKTAIELCAHFVLLAHNHPSGSQTPSQLDLKLTQHMAKAGEMMDIELADHVVCTPSGYTSIKSVHDYLFPK